MENFDRLNGPLDFWDCSQVFALDFWYCSPVSVLGFWDCSPVFVLDFWDCSQVFVSRLLRLLSGLCFRLLKLPSGLWPLPFKKLLQMTRVPNWIYSGLYCSELICKYLCGLWYPHLALGFLIDTNKKHKVQCSSQVCSQMVSRGPVDWETDWNMKY